MKERLTKSLIIFEITGFILMTLCLTACSSGAASGKQQSHLVYGAECIILKGSDETYYIIEKPQVNDEEIWEGMDPSLRHQWVKAEHGQVAGRILADVLKEHEFLDAKVSLQIPEDDGEPPCVDDIWDDEKISEDDVKALGLFAPQV